MKNDLLALDGGAPLRKTAFPGRKLMGQDELAAAVRVFEESWADGADWGYQGRHEERYTKAFVEFQGRPGYADAVSSGTAAVFVAIAALDLPRGSEIVYSPLTDPGAVSSAIMQGLVPALADAAPGRGFNTGPEQFAAALTPKTRAAVITHIGGDPVEIDAIVDLAKERGIRVVEDCSQSHGASFKGVKIGCFGDIAAFSTMFSKNHATGGCGGVVYTRDEALYWRARSAADRGKAFHRPDFDPKNARTSLFPALNFNQNELACAIGASTLAKLPATIARRNEIVRRIGAGLRGSRVLRPLSLIPNATASPFFLTLEADLPRLSVPKERFARALSAEGLAINADYGIVVAEWPWAKPHLKEGSWTPNAAAFRDRAINVLFNESFTDADADDVVACLKKVETALAPDAHG